MEDKRLIEIYWQGWNESFDGNDNSKSFKGLELTAYEYGWQHAIIGDEVTMVDSYTEDEILALIKYKWI